MTSTMTYAQLTTELLALPLHPLAKTNVIRVAQDRGAVRLEFDRDETDQLVQDLKDCEKERADTLQECSTLENKLAEANRLLDEIRDGEASFRQYVARTKQAEETAKKWEAHAKICEAETTALRKRKGLNANYFRLRDEVLKCIFNLATPEAEALKRQLYAE